MILIKLQSPRSLPSDFRRKVLLTADHNSLHTANTDVSYEKGNSVTCQLLSYGSYMFPTHIKYKIQHVSVLQVAVNGQSCMSFVKH